LDGPNQRRGLDVSAGELGSYRSDADEGAAVPFVLVGLPRPVLPLEQHPHAAVGQLQLLHDPGNAADGEGVFLPGIRLPAHGEYPLVPLACLFEGGHRGFLGDEDGDHGVGKQNELPKLKLRELVGSGFSGQDRKQTHALF
jgi:hypothetical protein